MRWLGLLRPRASVEASPSEEEIEKHEQEIEEAKAKLEELERRFQLWELRRGGKWKPQSSR